MVRNKINKLFIIPLFFSVVTIIIIFIFSFQAGVISTDSSLAVTRVSARLIFYQFDSFSTELQDEIISGMHFSIRKTAHFTIYSMLGLNLFLTAHFLIKKLRFQIISALVISIICAAADEINQYFIPGRDGNIFDVFIDTAGAAFGIAAGIIVLSVIYNRLN
ncbi:MAG: VanZ family protein [Oscillospiraceae bacterium]|jgi:VanZ family protein|nr:VanZ family protein [Oscillospiraceae bacterium]